VCNTASGAITGTLPDASFNAVQYEFKNIGANTLTVSATGGQLIYTGSATGAATTALTTGQSIRLQSLYDGTAWGWYAL
jgi:hypothetical protein